MTCTVAPTVFDLGRAERLDISWPIDGQSDTATAEVELEESGTWWALTIAGGFATGYFAGPQYSTPAPAHIVPKTSHALIKVTDGRITVIRDAGFIRLVP